MWALRRASVSIRKQGLNDITAQVCFATPELSSYCSKGYVTRGNRTAKRDLSVAIFHKTTFDPPTPPFKGSLSFSALAGTKSSIGNDDVLYEFSELNSFKTSGSIQEGNLDNESELESESEKSDEDLEGLQGEVGLSNTETRMGGTMQRHISSPELCKALLAASPHSVCRAMDKWVEKGNELTRPDIIMVMRYLRQRKLYAKALKVSEWLESSKHIELNEFDYTCQVDLIAKVRGLQVAEARIEQIPESFRSETVYRALLANCVSTFNTRKSEEVFKKMTDLRLPISCFTCNQLLLLYKRTDRKKIANVLLLMEKENVKPSLFTYKILIDAKGQCDDIAGVEEVVETMKNDGVEPDMSTKCLIARIYIRCGHNEKAEAMMKDIESDLVGGKSWAFTNLLPMYAILGKEDEVSRIWKVCESNPCLEHCVAAIEAWGRLKNIEKAEEVFEMMISKYPNMSSKNYSSLLNVYAHNKMLAKGKDLVKRMTENGCHIGISTWKSLVKLYIVAGELGKAESILGKASDQNGMKPMLTSYIGIISEYAKKGDIRSCEKLFLKMRHGGFSSRYWLYQTLVKAYVNANVPAYGMKERMKGDGVFPRGELLTLLPRVDPFQKTELSDLIE